MKLLMPFLFEKPATEREIRSKTHLTLGQELMDYLWYFLKVFVVVVIAYLFVKDNIFRSFQVAGLSMSPNYHDSDLVYVNKIAKRFGDIQRGDVVVFKEPDNRCPKTTAANSCYLIKRVIGLPGESVYTEGGSVYIINKEHTEGIKLNESQYLAEGVKTYADGRSEAKKVGFGIIPDKSYFVMGDNRTNSTDSRFKQVGFIDAEQIEGKEFYREQIGFFSQPKYNVSNN
jgi:signal peptidase I